MNALNELPFPYSTLSNEIISSRVKKHRGKLRDFLFCKMALYGYFEANLINSWRISLEEAICITFKLHDFYKSSEHCRCDTSFAHPKGSLKSEELECVDCVGLSFDLMSSSPTTKIAVITWLRCWTLYWWGVCVSVVSL